MKYVLLAMTHDLKGSVCNSTSCSQKDRHVGIGAVHNSLAVLALVPKELGVAIHNARAGTRSYGIVIGGDMVPVLGAQQ